MAQVRSQPGRHPGTVVSRAATLGRELVAAEELAAIARGRSDVAPAKGDKRFADRAWSDNPQLNRTMQAYLATNNTVNELFSDADLNWRDSERIRFVLDVLTEGLSPSNNPVLNPLGRKALIDAGGMSAVRVAREKSPPDGIRIICFQQRKHSHCQTGLHKRAQVV